MFLKMGKGCNLIIFFSLIKLLRKLFVIWVQEFNRLINLLLSLETF